MLSQAHFTLTTMNYIKYFVFCFIFSLFCLLCDITLKTIALKDLEILESTLVVRGTLSR